MYRALFGFVDFLALRQTCVTLDECFHTAEVDLAATKMILLSVHKVQHRKEPV